MPMFNFVDVVNGKEYTIFIKNIISIQGMHQHELTYNKTKNNDEDCHKNNYYDDDEITMITYKINDKEEIHYFISEDIINLTHGLLKRM